MARTAQNVTGIHVMKFYLPSNSESKYSYRSRGFLILENLNDSHGYITSPAEINGSDLYIIGKKFREDILDVLLKTSSKFILDINDYKLHRPQEKELYRKACNYASAFTTTCSFLAEQIKKELETDLPIYVIPDPTERKLTPPKLKKFNKRTDTINLVWYGSRKNLFHLDLNEIKNRLCNMDYRIRLQIITNKEPEDPLEWIDWSYDTQEKLVNEADFVFMPVGEKTKHELFVKSKGNNRPIDAICQGKFALTNNVIPSYLELSKYLHVGDVFDGLIFAIEHPKTVYDKIIAGQKYIEKNYMPNIVAQKWLQLERDVYEKSL